MKKQGRMDAFCTKLASKSQPDAVVAKPEQEHAPELASAAPSAHTNQQQDQLQAQQQRKRKAGPEPAR